MFIKSLILLEYGMFLFPKKIEMLYGKRLKIGLFF